MELNHLSVAAATVLAVDHGIVVTRVGVEPTNTRLSTSSLCQFAYLVMFKWRVRGSHPTIQAYEARLSAGSPAVNFAVAKGRFELPCRKGHDVLSVACIPVPPLGCC